MTDSSGPGSPNHPKRVQTDESLRNERNQVNANALVAKHAERTADEVLATARARADEVLERARAEADISHPARISALSNRRYDNANDVLESEHAEADALIRRERTQRRRYLEAFLASERAATDRDLNAERLQADASVGARDDFLGIVSHDLRTFLASLSLNADVTLRIPIEGESGAKIRLKMMHAKQIIARMDRLISDLIDIASIEAGKLTIVKEDVEIGEILRETADAFALLAKAKRINFAVNLNTRATMQIDAGRVLQVLANLISNAIKFTPEGGQISVDARMGDNEMQFIIEDSGSGMSAEALAVVFERYRQAAIDPRGCGLGLYISKAFVEAHGGRIWAESTVGVGSALHFALPLASKARATAMSATQR